MARRFAIVFSGLYDPPHAKYARPRAPISRMLYIMALGSNREHIRRSHEFVIADRIARSMGLRADVWTYTKFLQYHQQTENTRGEITYQDAHYNWNMNRKIGGK